jgi:hypothetical protein
MLLRTAQNLVKEELTSQETRQVHNPGPQPSREGNRERPAEVAIREPGPMGLEQPGAAGNNVDPYLASEDMNTPAGRQYIYSLYGLQEGGAATVRTRLPSTLRGSYAPKGLSALNIPNLGVTLVTDSPDSKPLRVLLWHSLLMVGNHAHWTAMGTMLWGADTASFMAEMYRGLSLDVFSRTPSQASCIFMFGFQTVSAFQNARDLLRMLTGRFHSGDNGIQLETFEITKGSARASIDGPDLLGRNKGIIDCLGSTLAFFKTFINEGLPNVFAPVQEALLNSESLHRTSSKILMKFLNTCYAVVFNALSISTSVKTIAHDQPVSIKGVKLFGQALLEVSQAIVVTLQSPTKLKAMEDDFAGRQAEDELRLRVINKFNGMGDLTVSSPTKKRGTDENLEQETSNKKKKEKKPKQEKVVGTAKVKVEPVTSPVKNDRCCVFHMASKLNIKGPNNIIYECPRGVKLCAYKHLALNKTQRDKAMKAATSCPDQTLKPLLIAGITGSSVFL